MNDKFSLSDVLLICNPLYAKASGALCDSMENKEPAAEQAMVFITITKDLLKEIEEMLIQKDKQCPAEIIKTIHQLQILGSDIGSMLLNKHSDE